MQKINIILIGYGNVGEAFVYLLKEKSAACQKKYGLDLRLKALFDIKFSSFLQEEGAFIFPSKMSICEILDEVSASLAKTKSACWQKGMTLPQALQSIDPGVMVECIPSESQSGEPGFEYIHRALLQKWNVATADKVPLVFGYSKLKDLAKKNEVQLKISGATAAALPTLDVALISLAGSEILQIEGILNGTTNYILSQMTKGVGYGPALKKAQSKGIADTDPSLDVKGWDTAYKVLLIANSVFQKDFSLDDIDVQGITKIDEGLINEAAKQGKKIKLLGKLWREESEFRLKVAPEMIDPSHPLFGVDGTNKGITFSTDTMAEVTVTGGKSDPIGAAAALLKDIINIYNLNYS